MTVTKLIAGVRRRPGLTHEQFSEHYRHRHGPLVTKVTGFNRHSLRYDQNYAHPASAALKTCGRDEYDAVTELWFERLEKFFEAYAEPDYMTYLREDEQRFVDLARGAVELVTEATIVDGPEAPTKLFIFRKRPDGLSREAFQQRWRERQLAAAKRPTWRSVRRAIHDEVLTVDTDIPGFGGYDLIQVFFFDDPAAAAAFCREDLASADEGAADDDGSEAFRVIADWRSVEGIGPAPGKFVP